MFERFRNLSRGRGRALRAVLIAMLAAVTGCDRKVAWRGVSTDRKAAGRAVNPDATTRGPADGKPG